MKKLKCVKCELIESVLKTRQNVFDFAEFDNLKTCVMKVANCNNIRPNNKIKNCRWERQGAQQFVCDKHKQTFTEPQLKLLSDLLPPDPDHIVGSISVLLKGVVEFESKMTEDEVNQQYDDFYADWIKYTQSSAFQTMKDIDDLPDDFVHCFFLIQALISVDWCRHKYIERTLPFFELGFFIPFAIIDPDHGVQFAKNIIKLGRKKVVKQCSVYVKVEESSFEQKVNELKERGYKGPFLICTDLLWSQLELFASS